jgi:hypothetical protein
MMTPKQKAEKETNAPASPEKKASKLTLDDVIVGLQKSFSRVSARSASVDPQNARALVTGQITFEMSLKADPIEDKLYPKADGNIELKLSGTIDSDVRPVQRLGRKKR